MNILNIDGAVIYSSEFPDDGSEKSEERALAFEFAKAAALRMKAPDAK